MKRVTVLASFFLLSCTTVQLNIHAESQEKTPTVMETKIKPSTPKLTCSFYHLTAFGPIPEIPVEQFSQLRPNEKDAKINLLVEHIRELRMYIKEYKNKTHEDYIRYVATCN